MKIHNALIALNTHT